MTIYNFFLIFGEFDHRKSKIRGLKTTIYMLKIQNPNNGFKVKIFESLFRNSLKGIYTKSATAIP